jgi:hypothetical protein
MDKQEAIKKGYLKEGKKVLKPILKAGKMVTDPKHIGYFMWEGASITFVLPVDRRGVLVTPFKNDEERLFFESVLNLDLNTNKKDNKFWTDEMKVRVSKDDNLMTTGIPFDMSDPMDNLRSRVLGLQDEVANSVEEREQNPHKKFLLIDIDEQDKNSNKDIDESIEIFTFFGNIKDSVKKMKEFLSIYINNKKLNKDVPTDATSEWLIREINELIKTDKKSFMEIAKDPDYEVKGIITKAVKTGAIVKSGVNSYQIVGEPDKRQFAEMVEHVKQLKKLSDDLYLKIIYQIEE